MTSTKVNQLQILQQNIQAVFLQKQQFQSQLVELDSALQEIKTTSQAYKIVGKVMIASSRDDLQADLQEKRELINVRLKNLERQENSLKENMEKLQKEVVEELKEQKKNR